MELLDLRFITRMFNERLGEDFRVITNAEPNITKSGRLQVVLQATRIPFAISEVESESIDITLTAYIPASGIRRDRAMNALGELLGTKGGEIESDNNAKYSYIFFAQFDKPLGSPNIDNGAHWQPQLLTVSMLLSKGIGGARFSNELATRLSFSYDGQNYDAIVPTLGVRTDLTYATETATTGNNLMLTVMHLAQTMGLEISALSLRKNIDDAIISFAYKKGINIVMEVERIFPSIDGSEPISYSGKYKVIAVQYQELAGAYAQYTLALNEITEEA